MEQEFLKLMFDERIGDFCREYGKKQKEGADASEQEDRWEGFLETLTPEQRETVENCMTDHMAERERELYLYGMKDGIRVMRHIMEIK